MSEQIDTSSAVYEVLGTSDRRITESTKPAVDPLNSITTGKGYVDLEKLEGGRDDMIRKMDHDVIVSSIESAKNQIHKMLVDDKMRHGKPYAERIAILHDDLEKLKKYIIQLQTGIWFK